MPSSRTYSVTPLNYHRPENNYGKYVPGTLSIISIKRHRKKCTLGFEAYVPQETGSGVASGIVLWRAVMEENSPDTMALPTSPSATRTFRTLSVTKMPRRGIKRGGRALPTLMKEDNIERSVCVVSILAVRVQ